MCMRKDLMSHLSYRVQAFRDTVVARLLPQCPHARVKVTSQHQVPPNPTRNSESPVFLALWQTDCHVTACHLLFPAHTQFALYFPVLPGLSGSCAHSVSWHWVSSGGWAELSGNAHQSLGWRRVRARPEKPCTFPSRAANFHWGHSDRRCQPLRSTGKKNRCPPLPLPQ